ncbi:MAG TPA: hypothetical protein VKT53_09360 [Candidatus Acidoferrum sp.]|nr:hypothetical protein [Candidatus Acidoferrum sp.]
MTRLRFVLGLMYLLLAALLFRQAGSLSPAIAKTTDEPTSCSSASLPQDLQSRLKADYSTWKIQQAQTLSEHARKTWEGKKPLACPGVAVGLFQGAKTRSYAVLLVPAGHPDAGYRFLVFSRKDGQSYEAAVVEQSDDKGASNYFIRSVPVSRFFGEASKKKFQVQAAEAILMVDSAEQEYEADLYFWSNGRFQQHPVDE